MVGGKIIGLVRRPDGLTTVNVQDTRYSNDTTAIRVREQRKDNGQTVSLSIGDSIWWQGREAMWTPEPTPRPLPPDECSKEWDIQLPREGYSFSS